MEREKRNQTASILMVVGIIFIVVAGTIFVSTSWKYLSAMGKQGILFLSTILLFLGSAGMAKKGLMKKTETALYYLGTSCLGLFTLSVCGEIMKPRETGGYMEIGWIADSILIAGVIMILPVILRFARKRTAFDFVMMALLADWILLWITIVGEYEWLGACVISAAGLSAYAIADYLRERWQREDKGVELAFIILYILHGAEFVVHNLIVIYNQGMPWIDDVVTLKLSLFVMALFGIGVTVLMQLTRSHVITRILNSAAIYWGIITGVNLLFELTKSAGSPSGAWNGEMQHFLIFVLCTLCMVVMARKEMVCMIAVWGGIIPFVQIGSYGDYDILFSHISHQVTAYVPFSGVLVLAMGILIYRKNMEFSNEQFWGYIYAVLMQGLVMIVVFYASKYPFWEKGCYALLTLQCLTIAFCFRSRIIKGLFRTGALFFGEILLFISSYDVWFNDYEVERFCLFAVAGIYLLSLIWNNYGSVMRSFQFAAMCVIMTIMLGNAMLEGEVGNALILGVTGVIILICAEVFNSRRYAVLSSVVLILLALYLTRDFWSSIEWWVYLFAAGVVLVVLAIRKERVSTKDSADF